MSSLVVTTVIKDAYGKFHESANPFDSKECGLLATPGVGNRNSLEMQDGMNDRERWKKHQDRKPSKLDLMMMT